MLYPKNIQVLENVTYSNEVWGGTSETSDSQACRASVFLMTSYTTKLYMILEVHLIIPYDFLIYGFQESSG